MVVHDDGLVMLGDDGAMMGRWVWFSFFPSEDSCSVMLSQ